MGDLLDETARLVDVASVSHDEGEIVALLEGELRAVPWLTVDRHGDNLVARTTLGRPLRLILAGHTDTVPANGNERARREADVLHGLGSADMKSGLAVFLDLARTIEEPAVDVTYVFYACEEVEERHSGLGMLFRDRPELLAGDAAVIGEPTDGAVEAGCQGSLRLQVTLAGERAHTARAWMGVNAIHRLGRALVLVEHFESRRPVIDGCEYREALQAVRVEGGVAGNVVPDRATLVLQHRFAPDRDVDSAEAAVRALLAPVLGADDVVERLDVAHAAAPGLGAPLLRALVERHRLEVRAKLGWTDVARFAEHGIPACNFGPGDPTLAHRADERVTLAPLETTRAALADVLVRGVAATAGAAP